MCVSYFQPCALVWEINTDKCFIILVNIYRKLMCIDRCAAWTTKAFNQSLNGFSQSCSAYWSARVVHHQSPILSQEKPCLQAAGSCARHWLMFLQFLGQQRRLIEVDTTWPDIIKTAEERIRVTSHILYMWLPNTDTIIILIIVIFPFLFDSIHGNTGDSFSAL